MSITVYTKPGCNPCRMTKLQMTKHGITSFDEVDVTEDEVALNYVKSLGYQQMPVVQAGEDHWSGFRSEKIKELALLLASH